LPRARELYDRSRALAEEGVPLNDFSGQCWPIGQPLVMTRVWPVHMVQLPTAILIVSNFDNRVRWIYLDGREHTDADLFAPAYQGEAIGSWHDDALVVVTHNFVAKIHFLLYSFPPTQDFHLVGLVTLSDDGEPLLTVYTVAVPRIWEFAWVETTSSVPQHRADHLESL